MKKILSKIKKIFLSIFGFFLLSYHFFLAFLGSVIFFAPSKKIKVIGITGTKGKSSTIEILNTILEDSGYKTSISSTIRFKIGSKSYDNLKKQTMPGRFFLQYFLRISVKEKIDFAIIEMTSEGAKQYRNRFINLDALIFTNLKPEHIEAHGGFENYKKAKLGIVKNSLETSSKKNKIIVVNGDDENSEDFLNFKIENKKRFSLKDAGEYEILKDGIKFFYGGEEIISPLRGEFNLQNILAAISVARFFGISTDKIKNIIRNFSGISGRVEKVEAGQDFEIIVDYAHTPDSLEKLYQAFGMNKKICVLGNTGGGRDRWKRPEMATIAERYCSEIILTNEDPYDEDPEAILKDMSDAIKRPIFTKILDRREAIKTALKKAKKGDSVLITGKGTDPYIMEEGGKKTPWLDSKVAKEEMEKILNKQ